MALRSLPSSMAFALAATLSLATTTAAQAQDLLEFLWGGSQEWGGSRQDIGFDSKYTKGQIIVSFGDRRLYLITRPGQATSYPIAVPREQSRWQGTTIVSDKRVNPSWRPTPEMFKENPKLPTWVPGGHRMNPLGVRAMYLGASTYRIHGTDAPWTIGQAVSKGCIRMLNEDVLDLYPKVPVGTRVTVTWERFTTDAVASGDAPAPYTPVSTGFSGYKSPSGPRPIRNLPPPQSDDAGETVAAMRNEGGAPEPAVVGDEKSAVAKPAAKSAERKTTEPKSATPKSAAPTSAEAKPADAQPAAKTAEPTQTGAATAGVHDAAEAANRAAAAASKAAVAARAAAETAKKAAEDARKATSADSEEQKEKGAEPGRSAAL